MLAGIVAGLKLLWDAFSSVAVFGDKVDAVLSGIGAAMQEVRDRVLLTASAIYKFFTGDFKGAFADAKKAATGLGDAIVDAFKRGKEAGEQMDAAMDQMRVLNMVQADMNKKLAEARELLTDETASYKDKKRALQEVKNTEDAYYSDLAKQHESYAEGVAKKYGVEKKFQEMVKAGTAEAKKTFDDYLQTILKDDKIKEIEDAYIQAQGAVQEYHDRQRANNKMDARIDREERQKGREEERRQAEVQKAYLEKLENLHNENVLSSIRDATQKKLKEAEISFVKERQAIDADLEARRITQQQHDTLMLELTRSYNNKVSTINEDHRREESDKSLKLLKDQEEHARQLADQKEAQKESEDAKRRTIEQRESKLRMDQNKKNLTIQKQELDAQMALKQWYYMQDLAAAGDNALKKREIEVQFNEDMAQLSEARKQIAASEAEAKTRNLEAVGAVMDAAAGIFGEQTAAGKAIAAAGATIDTYAAINKTLSAFSGVPIPGYAVLQAVATGIAGFKNVTKLLSVQVPKASSSASAPGGLSAATAAPLQPKPQVGTTQLDQQSINGIGNAASGRTFVLDRDIQNNRERAERLNRAARIG
jgi:hypothetical protein